jgi:hypothetical protein
VAEKGTSQEIAEATATATMAATDIPTTSTADSTIADINKAEKVREETSKEKEADTEP